MRRLCILTWIKAPTAILLLDYEPRFSAKDAMSSPWTIEEFDLIRPMTAEQAATLKRLAEAAYDHAAFKPNLTSDDRQAH